MYNHNDKVVIHWIRYEIVRSETNNRGILVNVSWWSNDLVFNKLWIKDKYHFCNSTITWNFPVHNSIEHLNVTIHKLINYWKYDNDFYLKLMFNDV